MKEIKSIKKIILSSVFIFLFVTYGSIYANNKDKELIYNESAIIAKKIAIEDEFNRTEIINRLKDILARNSAPVMIEISRPNSFKKDEKPIEIPHIDLRKIENYLEFLTFGLTTNHDAICFVDFKLKNDKNLGLRLSIKVDLEKQIVIIHEESFGLTS